MPSSKAILAKPVDLLCAGGLSLFVVVPLLVIRPDWFASLRPRHLALGTLLLNYPHFIASAWLVYRSPAMVKRHRWAAIGFPVALFALCVAAVVAAPRTRLGLDVILVANSVYLAWHYTGQAWGMVASFAALEGIAPAAEDRRWVRGSLQLLLVFHVLWALRFQTEFPSLAARSNPVFTFAIALIPIAAAAGAFGFVRWSRRTGRSTPSRVWVPWAALIAWYAAMASHPQALHLVQLGHALQYLPFPLRVELNREVVAPSSHPRREAVWLTLAWITAVALVWLGPAALLGAGIRPAVVPGLAVATGIGALLVLVGAALSRREGGSRLRVLLWAALLIQVGCLLFGFLPSVFARLGHLVGSAPGLGADATAMLVCFVNLHHYFTDGVAWKLGNPEVRRELFAHVRERGD